MAGLTTDDVLKAFVEQNWFREDFYTEHADDPYAEGKANAEYAFERWLAEHDREVAEKAWGAGYLQSDYDKALAEDKETENPYRKGQ